MKEEIKFQSYCWSIGTTSYRTDNFNMSIEKQLQLMYQFKNTKENIATPWKNNNELQRKYYEFLRETILSGDRLPDRIRMLEKKHLVCEILVY